MKSFLRNAAQALGLYEPLGLAVAQARGLSLGIRISRAATGDYRVRDAGGRVIVINKRHAIYLADMVIFFDFFRGAVVPEA
jgi:hypothetical protein